MGILIASAVRIPYQWIAPVCASLMTILSWQSLRNTPHSVLASLTAISLLVTAGVLSHRMALVPVFDLSSFTGARSSPCVSVTGTVEKVERKSSELLVITVHVRLIGSGEIPRHTCDTKVRVMTASGKTEPAEGDEVIASGRLIVPRKKRNPGGFDYRSYLRSRGISFIVDTRKEHSFFRIITTGDKYDLARGVSLLRKALRKVIHRHLQGESATLMEGLLLGIRENLDDEITGLFARAGIMHILAVSGLHVGIVIAVISLSVSMVRIPCRLSAGITLVCIVLYALLTGLRDSVIRASLMGAIVFTGRIMERQVDVYNSIGIAALCILLCSPLSIYHVGFQLSFVATLSIVWLYPVVRACLLRNHRGKVVKYRWMQYVMTLFSVSLAAQIGTAPLTLHYFGYISIWAPIVNCVIIPATAILVSTGLLGLAAGMCSDLFGHFLFGTIWVFARFIFRLSRLAGTLPWGSIHWKMSTYEALSLCIVIIMGVRIRYFMETPIRRFLVFLALVTSFTVFCFPRGKELCVTFLDVGQGDAIFIEIPNGPNYLIDSGVRFPGYDAGAKIVVPFLATKRRRTIDAVFLTHPHRDHVGGIGSLFRDLTISWFYFAPSCDPAGMMKELVARADENGIVTTPLFRGDRLFHDEKTEFLCLYPLRPGTGPAGDSGMAVKTWYGPNTLLMSNNPNNNSMVLMLQFDDIRFLFTGDIEKEVEELLLRESTGYPLRSQILKIPHHGSRTSSTWPFISAVSPEVGIVSVGARNRFGHPSTEVLSRYDAFGAQLFRTDRDGAVRITAKKHLYRIDTMLSGAR
jgi:competence protein ComEC